MDDGTCNGCQQNFWGPFCSKTCVAFWGNCLAATDYSQNCDQKTGYCSACALDQWGPPLCNYSCDAYLGSSRPREGMSGIIHAKPTYSEGRHQGACAKPEGEGERFCDVHTGACRFGCCGGFWGAYCDQTCPSSCELVNELQICDQKTGSCKSCPADVWGSFCNKTCPSSCERLPPPPSPSGIPVAEMICDRKTGLCCSCPADLCGLTCNQTKTNVSNGSNCPALPPDTCRQPKPSPSGHHSHTLKYVAISVCIFAALYVVSSSKSCEGSSESSSKGLLDCDECDGTGFIGKKTLANVCGVCGGTGRV
jgi:hypothetical protein